MTNYEKIRNMSIEEMAEFLGVYNDRDCVSCEECIMSSHCEFPVLPCDENALKWLKDEVAGNIYDDPELSGGDNNA